MSSTLRDALQAVLLECRDFFANCPTYDGAETGNLDTRCMDLIEALAAPAQPTSCGGSDKLFLRDGRLIVEREAPAQTDAELEQKTDEQERKAFEAWWLKESTVEVLESSVGDNLHKTCWLAWQAARANGTESEADARDAARYRWLRDASVPPHNFYLSVPIEFDGVIYTPAEVDAAIDAAMLAAGKVT